MTTSWGIVATVRADAPLVKRFIAHHLVRGADWMMIFFDDPELAFPELARGLEQVQTVTCRGDHYASLGDRIAGNVRIRQTFNAGIAYQSAPVDWLVHIDVDEFLIGENISESLAVSGAEYGVQLRPMEALETADGSTGLIHCKLPTGHQKEQAKLESVYPLWGKFLHSGLLSHRVGKTIVRTGIHGLRQRLHRVHLGDQNLKGLPAMPDVSLLHMHAPNWQVFWDHLQYRLSIGGYRSANDSERHRIHEMLSMLLAEEGEPGVRSFYDELQLATPELIARLKKHGLYANCQPDFDDAVAKVFPI